MLKCAFCLNGVLIYRKINNLFRIDENRIEFLMPTLFNVVQCCRTIFLTTLDDADSKTLFNPVEVAGNFPVQLYQHES